MSNFVTRDSGERQEFETGMVRDNGGDKIRFDLTIPPGIPYEHQMLTRFAELLTRGAEKYGAHNWTKAKTQEELDRFKESAIRHFMQWYLDSDQDEDHATAIWFNTMGAEYVKWRMKNSF